MYTVGTMKSTINEAGKKKPIVIAIVLAVLVLAVAVYFVMANMGRNLAQETAEPVKKVLVDGGAKELQQCTVGDTGNGPDNKAPNYSMIFETSLNRDQAIELINKAASSNGYSLKADGVHDDISPYSDRSKASIYKELEDGPVLLSMSIYDGKSGLGCMKANAKLDKDNAAIKLNVSLPNRR